MVSHISNSTIDLFAARAETIDGEWFPGSSADTAERNRIAFRDAKMREAGWRLTKPYSFTAPVIDDT